MWNHFYKTTQAIIFVVDSNDRERIGNSKENKHGTSYHHLHELLTNDLLSNCPVLVLANKQDLRKSMSVGEITTQLELNQLKNERKWHVEGCSMKTDEGFKSFQSGLEWIKSSF